MLQELVEPAWLDAFESVLRRCALQPGDTVAILAESQSRPVLVDLARLASARLGAQSFTLLLPSVFESKQPVARSTGASGAIKNIAPVVAALAGSTLVVDCTVEGLMHAPELPAILKGVNGTQPRVIYVSNEHPEALARLVPDDTLEPLVKSHVKRLRAAWTRDADALLHHARGLLELDGPLPARQAIARLVNHRQCLPMPALCWMSRSRKAHSPPGYQSSLLWPPKLLRGVGLPLLVLPRFFHLR